MPNPTDQPATDRAAHAALARIGQMADYWEQHLPEVIRTPAVVSAIRAALEPAVSAVRVPATGQTTLTEAERTMLAYALDQAQERIWSEGGFTDEDQAAVTSLRRLTVEPETGCTCAAGGDCFAPAGHYADCPEAAGSAGRVADGTQPETQAAVQCGAVVFRQPHGPHRWAPQPGMDPVRCPGACSCEHPEAEHSVYGCDDDCPCEYLPARKKTPMDPRHILGIDAAAPAVGGAQQQEVPPPVAYSGKGRVFCLSCPRPADENVPLTADDIQPYECCGVCGRHLQDVAEAQQAKEARP